MYAQALEIIDAPAVPGLVFRGYQGESDLPHLLEVINGSKAADKIDEVETPETIRNQYEHLSNCDPYRDVLIAELDGQVVGYSRVFWHELFEGGRVYTHFGFMLPHARGQGIGRAMVRHMEQRAREVAADHPPEVARTLQSFAWETEARKCRLLESEGYQIVRLGYEMLRPNLENIPEAPMPAGLEVRPVLPEHYRPIWLAANEAFQDHWGEEIQTDTDYDRFMGSVEFQPDIWKVAWDIETNEVAGMVLGYIKEADNLAHNRKLGWTENIAVRRAWRRRGVARALMAENLRELKRRGMTEAALGVDTENRSGALKLYLSMGFQPVKTERVYHKPLV